MWRQEGQTQFSKNTKNEKKYDAMNNNNASTHPKENAVNTTTTPSDKQAKAFENDILERFSKAKLTSGECGERADVKRVMDWNIFTCLPSSKESEFKMWLQDNKPSRVNVKDGVSWIFIKHQSELKSGDRYQDQFEISQKLWKEAKLQNEETVIQIAKETGVMGGKWMIWVPVSYVDQTWEKVANGIFNKRFGKDILSAKVLTRDENSKDHIILIYTKDFTNKEEVFECEKLMRKANILVGSMKYKPDICSMIGIYHKYDRIRPTLFTSEYDRGAKESTITVNPGYAKYLNNH